MGILNLKLSYEIYQLVLHKQSLPNLIEQQVQKRLSGYSRVMVYGCRTVTGLWVKSMLGKRFVCFVNSETFDDDISVGFDAVVLGTSPVHYEKIMKVLVKLETQCTIIKPFVMPVVESDSALRAFNDILTLEHFMKDLGWLTP